MQSSEASEQTALVEQSELAIPSAHERRVASLLAPTPVALLADLPLRGGGNVSRAVEYVRDKTRVQLFNYSHYLLLASVTFLIATIPTWQLVVFSFSYFKLSLFLLLGTIAGFILLTVLSVFIRMPSKYVTVMVTNERLLLLYGGFSLFCLEIRRTQLMEIALESFRHNGFIDWWFFKSGYLGDLPRTTALKEVILQYAMKKNEEVEKFTPDRSFAIGASAVEISQVIPTLDFKECLHLYNEFSPFERNWGIGNKVLKYYVFIGVLSIIVGVGVWLTFPKSVHFWWCIGLVGFNFLSVSIISVLCNYAFNKQQQSNALLASTVSQVNERFALSDLSFFVNLDKFQIVVKGCTQDDQQGYCTVDSVKIELALPLAV